MPYKPNYVNPKLNFTNLLKEEQSFLEKLSNLEDFRFEEDLKINGKRVRCAKVFNIKQIISFSAIIISIFQPNITRVAKDGLKYVNKRNDFWKEIPIMKHEPQVNQ